MREREGNVSRVASPPSVVVSIDRSQSQLLFGKHQGRPACNGSSNNICIDDFGLDSKIFADEIRLVQDTLRISDELQRFTRTHFLPVGLPRLCIKLLDMATYVHPFALCRFCRGLLLCLSAVPIRVTSWSASRPIGPKRGKLVRRGGFEPPRGCPRQPLKLVRLPVPPPPHLKDLARLYQKPQSSSENPPCTVGRGLWRYSNGAGVAGLLRLGLRLRLNRRRELGRLFRAGRFGRFFQRALFQH